MLFVVKEGSSDYKKVKKKKNSRFFKEPLTEWFFVEPKKVLLYDIAVKNLLKHLYFKSVLCKIVCVCVQVKNNMQIMYTIL